MLSDNVVLSIFTLKHLKIQNTNTHEPNVFNFDTYFGKEHADSQT